MVYVVINSKAIAMRSAMMTGKMHVIKGKSENKSLSEGLNSVLANSYALYLLTQNCHWNIKGEHFASLHVLFEQQYSELATAIDDTAERLRALGHYAQASFSQYLEHSVIEESLKQADAKKQVSLLLEGHEKLIALQRTVLRTAEELQDDGTIDFLGSRIREHEKTAWMLRSLLEK
jgi:starvation-inducible DNA-binding protein